MVGITFPGGDGGDDGDDGDDGDGGSVGDGGWCWPFLSTAYQKLNRLNQDLNLSAEYKINLKSRKTTFLLLLENDFQQTVSIYFQAWWALAAP